MNSSNMNNKINIIDSEVGDVNINYHTESNGFDFLHVGILGILIDVICYCIGINKEKKERRHLKAKSYNPQKGTYLDAQCRERLYSDDSLVFTHRNSFGEIEVEYQNGVKRNLSQEKYDKEPGTVTRLAGYDVHNKNHYFKTAIGNRYKDRRNGKIYVIRLLKYNDESFHFYMDVNNGKLIRPTDGQLKIEKKARECNKKYYTNEEFKNIMECFNSRIDDSDAVVLYRNRDNSTEVTEKYIEQTVKYR